MNWDALGTIAEVVGAVAVVASLVYLAVQVKQNTTTVSTATYDSIISGFNDVNIVIVDNANFASVFLRGNEDPSSLTDAEAVQYSFALRCWANQWLKLFRLYQGGAISEAEWHTFAREAAQAFDCPGGRVFRSENHLYDDLYQELDGLDRQQVSQVRLGATK